MKEHDDSMLKLSLRPFITALAILFALMILSYVLTLALPHGEFERTLVDGKEVIVQDSYHAVEGGISFWRWLASPFLVLGDSTNSGMIISISVFLLIIGGAFNALDQYGVLSYALGLAYLKFKDRKYRLLWIVSLCIMLLGSFAGSFEEIIPLVPIAVALAYTLGWDAMVGMGMSLLAVGFGFSAGIMNIFTVGVAQTVANIPLFSGASFRIITFVIGYFVLMTLLHRYAKKVEAAPTRSIVYDEQTAARWKAVTLKFEFEKQKNRALIWFAAIMSLMVLSIVLSVFVPVIQDNIMIFVLIFFFSAGTVPVLVAGMKFKDYLKTFASGALKILPTVLFILMANAVRFTMTEGRILDTVLNSIIGLTQHVPPVFITLIIYLLVLVMNFLISGGSSKAFLLTPLIVPVAVANGISPQLAILAFVYGDGFSNVFYPTNAGLLIALSLAGLGYAKWARFSFKYQAIMLVITAGLLVLAYYVGYGGALL